MDYKYLKKYILKRIGILFRKFIITPFTKLIVEIVFPFVKDKIKVSFIIAGSQKSGTTAIYHYLKQHPECQSSKKKELDFFVVDKYYQRGVDWYHKQFQFLRSKINTTLFFESSPDYLFRPKSLKRIYEYDNNMKIIILLRDPVSRAYSAYNMWLQMRETGAKHIWKYIINRESENEESLKNAKEILFGKEIISFETWVEREILLINKKVEYSFPYFIGRGLYYYQILDCYRYFPKKQVLILFDKELKDNKFAALNKLYNFLKIERIDSNILNLENFHSRRYANKLSLETEEKLREFYLPHDLKLSELIKSDLYWLKKN